MFHVRSLPGEALDHGLCYAQDPVTLLACDLLGARPGERILDACAAPGGKAAVLAEAMGGEGELVACDSVPARIEVLRANLARLGVPCATVVRHDWAAGGETVPEGTFDRILLDAPCTNSGVLRRRIDARWRLEPSDFTRMAALQETILRALVPLLRPGGVLVYSTCSVDPEENGAVAGKIAGAIPGLELVTEETRLPFRDGTDGAYAARFERAGQ
jgi:16S rRNA (cytosine967-C5)-methyltransferase